MSETTEITKPQAARLPIQAGHRGMVLTSLNDYWQFAGMVVGAGLGGKDDNRERVFLKLQRGAELGLSYMASIENIMVVNNRTSVWGDVMLGLCQQHQDWDPTAWDEHFEGTPYEDSYAAVCVVGRKGEKPRVTRYSVAQAKLAKLWQKRGHNGQDTPWITNPDRMLQMRARSFGLRDKFADVLKGIRTVEEERDIRFVEAAVTPVQDSTLRRLAELSATYAKQASGQTVPSAEASSADTPTPENAEAAGTAAGTGAAPPAAPLFQTGDDLLSPPEPTPTPQPASPVPPETADELRQRARAIWDDLNPDVSPASRNGKFAADVKAICGKHPDKCGVEEWQRVIAARENVGVQA